MKRVHSFSLLVDKYLVVLYYVYNKSAGNEGVNMIIKIDFQSDEALYIQLRNQIIMGIATDMIREGCASLSTPAGRGCGNQYAHRKQGLFPASAGRDSDH